jgi:thiol-disulfide isomerase/thioredoxin
MTCSRSRGWPSSKNATGDPVTGGSSLLRLPLRVGQAVTAPGDALARIEAEGGGFRDAVALVVVGAIAFRLPDLLQALLAMFGPTSGAFLRVVGVFGDEAREAAWIVVPAAVAITALAGKSRDPSLDLELGAACYHAFFVVRGLTRALDAAAGMRVLAPRVTWIVAGAAALVVLVRAIGLARGRPVANAQTPGATTATTAPATTASAPGTTTAFLPRARLAALAVVALAVVGVAGNAVWSARHLDALRPMRRGQPAPDFALRRIDGDGSVAMKDLAGQVVLLDFWATWCPPCIAMLPTLDRMHRAWAPRGVAFVAINSDGGGITADELKQFLVEHPIPYPVVLDEARVGHLYKVEALPTLVVVGRDGRVRTSFMGMTTEGSLERALREALDDAPPQ